MTQQEALDILKLGKNVYLTGQAGSGKTHLLNEYIRYLKESDVSVAVTASTGIAATHMNGITIHSWSGLGIRDTITDYDLEAMEEKKYLWERMEDVKVLIIDEVSMLHHFRLDLVEKIVRSFKRNREPFGGIQVVLCGDFFQLPPVARQGEEEPRFIYESESWKRLNLKICYLEEQFRQTDDKALEVLNAIRTNKVTDSVRKYLLGRLSATLSHISPTRLYTHNVDVDSVNKKELESLEGISKTYEMDSKGNLALLESLKKSCLAPEKLLLKKGAKVVFVKNNYEAGYVNGTLGIVLELRPGEVVVETKDKKITAAPVSWAIEEEGKKKAEIIQIPLRHAWALTVHKSQGMSLDAIEVDLSKSFEKGMGYVALSRVRTLEGLSLLGLNENALQVDPEVLEFDEELREKSKEAAEGLKTLSHSQKTKLQREYLLSIAPDKKEKKKKIATEDLTLELALSKSSLKEMARKREMTVGTILSHLEKLVQVEKINPENALAYLKPARFLKIKDAFLKVHAKTGEMKLSPVRDILGPSYDFEELRLARLFLKLGE